MNYAKVPKSLHKLGALRCDHRQSHRWDHLAGIDQKPRAGDVRICRRCGSWSCYDEIQRRWDHPSPRDY